ncbi:MAG: protein YgfX [Pseudomonadota bacterium]
MSIAVSATLRPSRALRALVLAYAAALALAAPALAGGALGRFGHPLALGGACLLAAGAAARGVRRLETTRQIDISGVGQIRLTVQQKGGGAAAQGAPLRLMAGSTLWPRCLVLVLGGATGRRTVLLVLPDSVADGQFRLLAVALGVVASHKIV